MLTCRIRIHLLGQLTIVVCWYSAPCAIVTTFGHHSRRSVTVVSQFVLVQLCDQVTGGIHYSIVSWIILSQTRWGRFRWTLWKGQVHPTLEVCQPMFSHRGKGESEVLEWGWGNYPDLGGPVTVNLKWAACRGKPISMSKSWNGFNADNTKIIQLEYKYGK